MGRTNDRGEYRLYWVTPGRYILSAGSTLTASIGGGSPNEVQVNYGSAFFPGVTDQTQASVIEVQPGLEVSNINLAVPRQQLYQVRGRVIDGRTGQPPPTVGVLFESRTLSGGYRSRAGEYNAANGTFEVRDVAPGSYLFAALLAFPSRVQTVITVTDSNVDGIVVTGASGVSIPGRMIVEGQALSTVTRLERMRVELSFVDPRLPSGTFQPYQAQFSADGTFREDDVTPGDYRVTVTSLPPDFYIKEARFDQTDVLNKPLHFSGSVPGPLDIMLSPKAGRIDGTVANGKLQPMPGIQAVLIPDQHRDWPELYKTAVTDQNGRFTILGIPPGAYKVFAWEALDQFAYFDPDLLARASGVVVAHDLTHEPSDVALRFAELLQSGLARLRAEALDTELVTIPTRAASSRARSRRTTRSRTRRLRHHPAGNIHEEVVAILFADAVNFSRLTNDEVPMFVEHFVGLVAALTRSIDVRLLAGNTWGDGFYFVFPTVGEAGRFALALSERIARTEWSRKGLPKDMNVRIGLHAGPTFACIDPITHRRNYVGAHVSRAARIEPITPPGSVYASEGFAAIAAATNVLDFVCEYAGLRPLAKGYGTFGTYRVHARRPAPRGP